MGGLSIWHWLIVLLVVVLIFGTKKLRNIGKDLGGAVKGFKDGMKSSDDESHSPSAAAADPRGHDHRGRGEEGKDAVSATPERSRAAASPQPCSTSAFPRSSSSPSWR